MSGLPSPSRLIYLIFAAGFALAMTASAWGDPTSDKSTEDADRLSARLAGALRELYAGLPRDQRDAWLLSRLQEPLSVVRLVALDLAEARLASGDPLAPELEEGIRAILDESDPSVVSAAIQVVAALGNPQDEPRFLSLLGRNGDLEVRRGAIAALGFVGTQESLTPLLGELGRQSPSHLQEAIGALRRLAERDVLSDPQRERAAEALHELLGRLPHDAVTARARALAALGRMRCPASIPVLLDALDSQAPIEALIAAVRAMAAFSGAEQSVETARAVANAVSALTVHHDATVRRTAFEALARFARRPERLEIFARGCDPERESEPEVRAAAWRGFQALAEGQPADRIVAAIHLLPDDDDRPARGLRLLELADQACTRDASPESEHAAVLRRLGEALHDASEPERALTAFRRALVKLHRSNSDSFTELGPRVLRLALKIGRYGPDLAAELTGDADHEAPLIAAAWYWREIRPELEERLRAETVDSLIAALRVLRDHPPGADPDAVIDEIELLLTRAQAQRDQLMDQYVREALDALRINPEDEAERMKILTLGPAAILPLAGELERLLGAEDAEVDSTATTRIIDLLRELVEDWDGLDEELTLETLREAVSALLTPASAPASAPAD